MGQEIFRLFVYGSLRSGNDSPAYKNYISSYFTLEGRACVKGKLYDMGEYPGAVPDETEEVVGELYHIRHPDIWNFALEQLDDYESVRQILPGEKPLFRREAVTVYYENDTAKAWIYWFNRDITGRPLIASGDYLLR